MLKSNHCLKKNREIKVGLIQINNSFSNQNYLPYSLGCLQTFAGKNVKNIDQFEFLLPIYSRISVKDAVSAIKDADIVFFSAYVWNIKISLEISKQIKQIKPDVLTVFGGPQVPDRSEIFLREQASVDIVCHGEGEKVFSAILEQYLTGKWDIVPSISYINDEDRFIQHQRGPRIPDLSEVPSPFLSQTFDPLMDAYPHEKWIVMWETNRGCPFKCTFCDWGSAIAAKVYKFNSERLFRDIDWFSENKIEFVFCCDANFGIFPRDLEIVQYMAKNKAKYGYPQAFSVQNTKNSTEKSYEIQKALADAGLNKGVTLSLQSTDDRVLEHIKRSNIKSSVYRELQQKFTAENIETYTDIILGLPEETYESFVEGVSSVIENGQHNRIQFANLAILPNAEMGDPEYQKKYGFIIQETDIINLHGSLENTEEIMESQHLVVGTHTMPKRDWVRARAFSWMTGLLHFNKLLQTPFIVLHTLYQIPFRELLEIFANKKLDLPILSELYEFFTTKALDIQHGGAEYCRSKEWLNIWWPIDEYIFIKLCVEGKFNSFYEESQCVIQGYLNEKKINCPSKLLQDAITLNKNLIKFPFQNRNLDLKLGYNIWEFYKNGLKGIQIPLKEGNFCYQIDRESAIWNSWEDWYREVVWYGNKKGDYLYECKGYE
ncbi:MAG: radical SAM protein [Deltaproteobacteria bacterium]